MTIFSDNLYFWIYPNLDPPDSLTVQSINFFVTHILYKHYNIHEKDQSIGQLLFDVRQPKFGKILIF